MLTSGPAKKVTIFINEDTQHHMSALHDSILTFLPHKGVDQPVAPHFVERGQHLVHLLRGLDELDAVPGGERPLARQAARRRHRQKAAMMDVAGATVYRGILGYGAKGHGHKASFLHPMRDLPIMVSVIDAPEKVAAAEAIEGMLTDGLIVISDAEFVRLVRGAKGGEV
jgi:PII-like signaling protein